MNPLLRGRLRPWAAGWLTLVTLAGGAALAPAALAGTSEGGFPLPPAVEAIMHKPGYEHAQWGVYEVDPSNGQVIHSQFANQSFVPGSDTKLVTLSAAWHSLGPDHRFTTPVFATGTRRGTTLDGNLGLVAQGDLTMGGRTEPDGSVDYTNVDHTSANDLPGATLTPENPLAGINQIARQVRAAGITRVNGNVLIDVSIFAPPELDPQPTPLIINDNLIDLQTTPTAPGQKAKLFWRPQVQPYKVTFTVSTVAADGPTDITVKASPDGTRITVSGTIAAGSQPVLRTSPIVDPNTFGRTALIEALGRAGVTVTAKATGPNPEAPGSYAHDPQVAAYVSPPYHEYAKLILKVSHNLGANLALCNMATVVAHTDDCFGGGFAVEHRFLTDVAHVDPQQFQLDDGRGGDATEKATPIGLSEILDYWLHTPDATAFRRSLPILGVNGSNAISCPDCPAKGKVFAKPGTVIGLDRLNSQLDIADQSQAGYLLTDDGHLVIFVVLVNSATTPDIAGAVRIFDDTNQISALLQEEASAHL
ncbi:D-alanyl-D-alanine carboxypeptidase/D-alanyl-D-alanine endopeptidase [Streptacidiphilus jiangxiensis]|uniref:D-alanyl-D-alanine carboxypeptidase / D-alanyl-D-alanine-endopeptidase (Penicillin-binding protein 4) n=1 Tax=Streptacidiphilus jiangxiensis TaxID=235985 RepID=A0A1H7ZEU8_STRJI|nr:D-alanyl-D-alanine carboxypeptidase/D-alanyl-D-alanine-endopeptidase [Streptacidiphilus jiangxiensis]SEM56058.1 D-alanyl-D-alanine carboxypeptidase / D-alanyl-D-alanine-endopeptidase (penicillin-binding protein 4) [Streptacidiphilus jiangxiensis]